MESIIKMQVVFAVVLTIALIGFLLLVNNLNKDGIECAKNPLIFGVSQLQPKFNNPIFCSCIADNIMLIFNDTTLKAEYITSQAYD